MKEILFEVPFAPTPQQRHRTSGKRTYDPSAKDKADFLALVRHHAPESPVQGVIRVSIGFGFRRPKSHFGAGKNAGVLKKTAAYEYIKKPDVDNLAKFVLDALNGVFFKDDCQVNFLTAWKHYSESAQIGFCMRWSDEKRRVQFSRG